MQRDFPVNAKSLTAGTVREGRTAVKGNRRWRFYSGLSGGFSPAGRGWRSTFSTIETIE